MFADWTVCLLLSSALLSPVSADYGQASWHEGAAVKRQAQDTGKPRWDELQREYLVNLRASTVPGGQCTWDNMLVRREW